MIERVDIAELHSSLGIAVEPETLWGNGRHYDMRALTREGDADVGDT
jgi:hypothetical protein